MGEPVHGRRRTRGAPTPVGPPGVRTGWVTVGLVLLVVTGRAAGQDTAGRTQRTLVGVQRDTQAQVDAAVPLSSSALVDYGAYATFNYLSFDDATHNNHGLVEPELVLYGQVNLDAANEVYARARGEYLNYNPGDSPDGRPNRVDGVVEEAWYGLKLAGRAQGSGAGGPAGGLTVRAGRQFVDWGQRLTLDQYADGVSATVNAGRVSVDLLACVTIRQTVDFDVSRPDLDVSTERGFYGAKVTVPVGTANPYAYFLNQRDYNRPQPLDAHVYPTRYRYESYYAGLGVGGPVGDRFLYAAEGCFEGGRGLGNSYDPTTNEPVAQTADPIEAYAANARVDYLPGDDHRSRLSVEGVIASGDRDRITTSATFGGNRPHTGDHAFNALGDTDTGLAFGASLSNVMAIRVSGSTYPFATGGDDGGSGGRHRGGPLAELQVGADLFVFGKTTVHAPIDEPTLANGYLGVEPDLFLNWRPADDLTVLVRYGLFFPGSAIPSGQPNFVRQFLYAGVTYAI